MRISTLVPYRCTMSIVGMTVGGGIGVGDFRTVMPSACRCTSVTVIVPWMLRTSSRV
jgi:hypothetical protein